MIVNPFWKEVILAWSEVAENSAFMDEDLLTIGLWFSDETVKFRSGQLLSWKQKGIVRVNDLLREDGTLLYFSEIKRIYR